MIQISGLNKSLYGGGHRVDILNAIDLTIPSGQFVAITGASGSGKTTLLSLIAGLDTPTEGVILIDDQDITKLNEDELAELRGQRFGFIFQSFYLIPTLTALENVVLSAELNSTNGSWLTMSSAALVSSHTSRMSCSASRALRGSRLPVGSSASTMSGSLTKALARHSLCCSPPESWAG